MKLLVSGASGFIGKHLVNRLLKDGHDVSVIVRPSSKAASTPQTTRIVFDGDVENLITVLQTNKFDGVIHLASLFLAQHTPADVPALINSNLLFSTALLEAAVKSNVPWFINTGTFWQHYENSTYSPVNLYAATKQAFMDIAQYYLETSPINFVTLKLCDTFGPGDVRPKIFNLWLKISQTGETLEMSPGEQLIDISYIDNVIDGYVQMMNLLVQDMGHKLAGQSFALKSNERMTLKDLAQVFEKVTHAHLMIRWGKKDYRPREVMIPWEDGQTIPGWQPMISLAEGIKKTFNQNTSL